MQPRKILGKNIDTGKETCRRGVYKYETCRRGVYKYERHQPMRPVHEYEKRRTGPFVEAQPDTSHCTTPQHTATHCNTLQHTATHCNTLQHTAAHISPTNMSKETCRDEEKDLEQRTVET